jgi:hypothetical protein
MQPRRVVIPFAVKAGHPANGSVYAGRNVWKGLGGVKTALKGG